MRIAISVLAMALFLLSPAFVTGQGCHGGQDAKKGHAPPPEGFLNMGTVSSASETPANYDYSINPFQLLSASIRFSDDGTKQKLNFSPLKLRGERRCWDGLTLNVVNGGSTSTFGLGLSYDQAAAYGGRFDGAAATFRGRRFPSVAPIENETDDALKKRTDLILLNDYEQFWTNVMARSFALTVAGNVQTFSNPISSRVDLDGDGKIDNEYSIKAIDGSGTVLYRFSLRSSASVTGRYAYRRTSAVEGTHLLPYYGGSATASTVLKVLDPSYITSTGFRSNLYIPSLVGGVSLDYQHCNGSFANCENRIQETWTITPFADVRLSGGAQFRLGLPIRHDRIGDKSGTRVQPLAQLGFALTGI